MLLRQQADLLATLQPSVRLSAKRNKQVYTNKDLQATAIKISILLDKTFVGMSYTS